MQGSGPSKLGVLRGEIFRYWSRGQFRAIPKSRENQDSEGITNSRNFASSRWGRKAEPSRQGIEVEEKLREKTHGGGCWCQELSGMKRKSSTNSLVVGGRLPSRRESLLYEAEDPRITQNPSA